MMKRVNKSKKIERRGRKAGDGVLQNIDPHGGGLEKRLMLVYGRDYRDDISFAVRWTRSFPSMIQDLKERRKELTERQIIDAEHIQISDNKLSSNKSLVLGGKKISIKALRYWKYKRLVEKVTNETRDTMHQEMDEALLYSDSSWFQKVASAIEAEKVAAENTALQAYPLHQALLSIAGVPEIMRTAVVYPLGNAGSPINSKPRYTISEVCKVLEKQGKRPALQEDAEWKREVRRACKQIGFPLLPSKSGLKRQK